MTRAQYEAKYGVKPVISTSTLDTTPAPIRMTRSEYESTYGVKPFGQTQPQSKGVLGDIPSDISETARGFVGAARQGGQNIQRAFTQEGLSVPQRIVGATVAAPSAVVNMFGEAGIGAAKLFTSDEFEKAVSKKVSEVATSVGSAKLPIVEKSLVDLYNALPDEDKYTLTNIIAPVANIATAIPVTKGAGAVVSKAVDVAPDLGVAIKNTTQKFANRGDEKALQGVVDAIAKVEDKYAPLRKANKYSKDVTESRTRIAQSGVLEKAVDNNGLINGELAAKIYKQENLDGTENLVRKELEKEGATVNPAQLKTQLEVGVMDSGLEGADLLSALKSIDSHIEGLSKRADELGNIPLYRLQDAKINETNNINFQTPPETKRFRKTVARVYKEMIENESKIEIDVDGKKVNVKGINTELGKYLRDAERLEALNGRIVDKGKVGKYAASLAGTAVGMGLGSGGGALGAAAGGILGGEVSAALVGRGMKKTFKGGGKGLPESRILAEAKKGAGTNLRVPDRPMGAPKNVPKTKDIVKTEGLIKKNVALQEAAIKAGDFTLVQKLKEIYKTLIEQLKVQVRAAKETMKDQRGFARNPFVKDDGQSIPLSRNQRKTTTPANTNDINKTVTPDSQTVKADTEDSIVLENLMRLDPIDTDPADTYRFIELQRKAEQGPLTEDEILEARAIVENTDGTLPKAEAKPNISNLNWNSIPEEGARVSIPLNKLRVTSKALERAKNNIQRGDGSRTSGPIEVAMLKDGTFAIVEGHHRTVQKLLQGDDTVDAIVYSTKDSAAPDSIYDELDTTFASSPNPLLSEAKKYKSAEEFKKAMVKDTYKNKYSPNKLMPTEIGSLSEMNIRAMLDTNGVTPLVTVDKLELGDMLDVVPRSVKMKRFNSPNDAVVDVYRVVPDDGEINAGDYVFVLKKDAEDFMEKYGSKRGQTKIVEKELPFSELVAMKSNGQYAKGELVYAPKEIQNTLEDTWKEANKK